MSPIRAKTYARLFAVVSLSVLVNLLLLQPRLVGRSHGGASQTAAQSASTPTTAQLAAIAPKFATPEQTIDTVRAVQRELRDLGHFPGSLDGRLSQLTHAAVFAYEQQNGLAITGEPSEQLLKGLVMGRAEAGPSAKAGEIAPGSPAEKLVTDIRQLLTALGYASGRGDGRLSPELTRAIKAYETAHGLLPPTGRITAPLVLHLQRKAAAAKPRTG